MYCLWVVVDVLSFFWGVLICRVIIFGVGFIVFSFSFRFCCFGRFVEYFFCFSFCFLWIFYICGGVSMLDVVCVVVFVGIFRFVIVRFVGACCNFLCCTNIRSRVYSIWCVRWCRVGGVCFLVCGCFDFDWWAGRSA